MRLLADENISQLVVARLVQSGLDVARVADLVAAAPDEYVLRLAASDQRLLLTEDRDFGELVVRRRLPIPGVVLIELDQLSPEAAAARVASVLASLRERVAGHLVVIEPHRTRMRPLPARS